MYTIIFTISFFLPLFYFALIITKKEKLITDKILALLILAMGIHLVSSFLKYQGYWDIYPHLVGLTVPLPFVYGPLIYLFIYYAIHTNENFDKRKLIHFLPFLLVIIFMSKFYFFYTTEEKRLVDAGKIHDFDLFTNVILVVFVISILFYTIFSFKLLVDYKKDLKESNSDVRIIDIKWIRGIIWGFGGVFSIIIISGIVTEATSFEHAYDNNVFFNFLILIMFLAFGFYGIRDKNLFGNTNEIAINKNQKKKSDNPSYENSGLKDEVAFEKHKELLQYMDREKPYLEHKLSLRELAENLSISPNYLSQIINQYEKQNFNDFVNKYRINEFIKKASENNQFNLLGLALDSGFNSKSTFNSVFKKHKGVTPSQYISSLENENIS